MITVAERARAISRAKQALSRLEDDPTARTRVLGVGRDWLNRVHNQTDHHHVWTAVTTLEDLVDDVVTTGGTAAPAPGERTTR